MNFLGGKIDPNIYIHLYQRMIQNDIINDKFYSES